MIEQKDGTELPEQEKEIIYIRYDDANMKFVYLCVEYVILYGILKLNNKIENILNVFYCIIIR